MKAAHNLVSTFMPQRTENHNLLVVLDVAITVFTLVVMVLVVVVKDMMGKHVFRHLLLLMLPRMVHLKFAITMGFKKSTAPSADNPSGDLVTRLTPPVSTEIHESLQLVFSSPTPLKDFLFSQALPLHQPFPLLQHNLHPYQFLLPIPQP